MEEWLKLAGQVTATGLLGFGLRVVWSEWKRERAEKEALQEKRIADQKEWLETARRQAELQHRAVKVLEKATGRSVTPPSR